MHAKAAVVIGLAALVACQPVEAEPGCRADQLDQLGACCTGWLVPDGVGCVPRVWTKEALQLGEAGAGRVEVSVDGNEHGLVVWQANADNQLDTTIVIAEQTDAGWLLSRPGQELPGFGVAPTVATDELGRALVTWKQQEVHTGAVYLSERSSEGAWRHPAADQPLSFPPTAYEPRPVFAPSGETLVVWNQWTTMGYGVAIARRRSDATTGPLTRPASATDVLSPPVNFSNAPQLDVAANGDAIVTWYQSPNPAPGDATELVVFASERMRETGEFGRPNRETFVSAPGAAVDSHPIRNPLATISDVGEIVITWTQDNGAGAVPVYLAHRSSRAPPQPEPPRTSDFWTVPTGLQDAFSPAQGRALSAQPRFGAGGELFVVWYHDRGVGPEVWAAHRTADGQWDVPGDAPELLSSPGAEAVDPRLVVGPDGQALVVWQERDQGPWRVMSRQRNAGADQWTALQRLSDPSDSGPDATKPTAAIGPTGAALATWIKGSPLAGTVVVRSAQ